MINPFFDFVIVIICLSFALQARQHVVEGPRAREHGRTRKLRRS